MFKNRKLSVSKTGREVFEEFSNNDEELDGYQRIISTIAYNKSIATIRIGLSFA